MNSFPIDSIKSEILDSLDLFDFLIIKSTAGSGKTTRVPLFLREKFKKKIYILEPRKLAAKLASEFVSSSLGEKPGMSVGHIFKYENMTSDLTQVQFLTEGTFLRILANNPTLDDCDVVILDEFHERHYYTDVALSFLLKIKETNKNLKIIIMSATIDLQELESSLSGRAKALSVTDSQHRLEIEYLPNDSRLLKDPIERKVYHALGEVLQREGHVLIFLPGMSEIKKCEELIRRNFDYEILILHGDVSGVTIDESFDDLLNKKIILSTNIAESSVTIPGVRTVIDSGLHKVSRLNPVSRLSLIELKKISKSSALQRASRASRQDDGLAVRLYSEIDYHGRAEFDVPEINRVDLSELILSAAGIFKSKLSSLTFLNPLSESEVSRSEKYLEQVGLLNNQSLTIEGKILSKMPFHPRISKILQEASKTSESTYRATINYLAEMVEPYRPDRFKSLANKSVRIQYQNSRDEFEKIVLAGYVDQIAKLKNQKLIHMNGEVYEISHNLLNHIDPQHSLWIILDLDSLNRVTRLLPIEEEWLYDLPFFPIEESRIINFDVETLKYSTERITRIGAIVLTREKERADVLDCEIIDHAAKKLMNVFKEKWFDNRYTRLQILEKYTENKINQFDSKKWFFGQVEFMLKDKDYGLETVFDLFVLEIFNFLNDDGAYDLDWDLPLFLNLHDKRKVAINYDVNNGIHCESYIQDFYGLTSLPKILQGKEKVKVHLLGPHKRPLQVTHDLTSFWNNTYKELFNELKREYPRHYWPLNPAEAKPFLLLRQVH